MDGRRVPADVLFFYKTLPLCTAVQGSTCHGCDEWPLGNIFTSDPKHIRGCSHRHIKSSMQPCTVKLVNRGGVFFTAKTHKNQREWVWKPDGDPEAACWPFMCLLLCGEYTKRHHIPIVDFAPNGVQILFITFFDLRPAIRNVFLVPLICHWIFPLRPVVFKGIFSYVTRQSMKNRHQKRLLLALERLDKAEELAGE